MVEISEIFSTSSQTSVSQDPIVTCVRKKFIKKFLLVLGMAVLECFWWKYSQKPLGVKEKSEINLYKSLPELELPKNLDYLQ